MGSNLSNQEIMILVNRYIGVNSGYLGNFSYRTHKDFYPEYCGLDIDPNEIEGTTRERFIEIISNQKPKDQAAIIRGVIERFPIGEEESPKTRTNDLKQRFLKIADRLDSTVIETDLSLADAYTAVRKSLDDAEVLLKESDASSCVDRIFTALHGFLEAICVDANIQILKNESIIKLFNKIRDEHPAFISFGSTRRSDIIKIMRSLSAIVDTLQPIRNNASLAHPNKILLDPPEAILIINTTKSIIIYLDNKITRWKSQAN